MKNINVWGFIPVFAHVSNNAAVALSILYANIRPLTVSDFGAATLAMARGLACVADAEVTPLRSE